MIAIGNQTWSRGVFRDDLANDLDRYGTQFLEGGAVDLFAYVAPTIAEGPVQRISFTSVNGRKWYELRDVAHKNHECAIRTRIACSSWSTVVMKFMLTRILGTSLWNDGYDITDGIGFTYYQGSTTNFEAYAGDGTVPNSVHIDTGILPVNDQYYSFEVRRDANSDETRFYIDDSLVATMNAAQSAVPIFTTAMWHLECTLWVPIQSTDTFDVCGFGMVNQAT